jgi:hypothetical protein
VWCRRRLGELRGNDSGTPRPGSEIVGPEGTAARRREHVAARVPRLSRVLLK